jgi:hypothetical protein
VGAGVTGLMVRQFDELGNRNDCRAYRESGVNRQCQDATVMADGGCQGNPEVIMPYRSPANDSPLTGWKHGECPINGASLIELERLLDQSVVDAWPLLSPVRL